LRREDVKANDVNCVPMACAAIRTDGFSRNFW